MKILITGGTNGMGKGVAIELAKANNNSNEIITTRIGVTNSIRSFMNFFIT